MKHATLEDFGTIRKLFDAHLDIFPYLRNDTLREKIEGIGGSVVFEDNVVIIYLRYVVRKMIGNARANVGDVVIHELVKGDGGNAKNVIENFFSYFNSLGLYFLIKCNICVYFPIPLGPYKIMFFILDKLFENSLYNRSCLGCKLWVFNGLI